ncbi:hypothetical protein, partial [Cryobacterium ruanii]|uniref:hypothetical protein n=1 Tax=Cryobacterium ruanii TaxID=1259197 RepID=UPI001A7EA6BA
AQVKATNQSPIFHCDHPSIVLGWPSFKPSILDYISTVADMDERYHRVLLASQALKAIEDHCTAISTTLA